MSLALNCVRCVRARVLVQWTGAWIADVDLDPDGSVDASSVPVGAASLVYTSADGTTATLKGTVDPSAAGRWVAGVPLRLVAGAGGWDREVPPLDFQSPSGVSAFTVEQATAALVGETVNDPQPTSLGLHWCRVAGPASRVFVDRDWYVDLSGVTQVGTWPAAKPDPSVELLEWDPLQQRGQLAADALILPGTVLTDARFDGPITVRDVEIVFEPKGVHATVWCSDTAVPRFVSALQNAIVELGNLASLRPYLYRVAEQSGAMLSLQAVDNPDGSPSAAPDVTEVVVWPGMQGDSGQYLSSSLVRVTFLGPGFSNPFVVGFEGTALPTERTIDATSVLHVGPSAIVKLAENAPDYTDSNVTCNGDPVQVMLPPLCPLSGTINGSAIPPGTLFLSVAFPLPGVVIGGRSKVLA